MGTRAKGDVVVNAHGEGVWLLKYHANSFSQQINVHFAVDVLTVQ